MAGVRVGKNGRPSSEMASAKLLTSCPGLLDASGPLQHKAGNHPRIPPSLSSPKLSPAPWRNTNMTPAGLEPAIPGSVGRCLIHWATGPVEVWHRPHDINDTAHASP
jgi:hypothetical protein